MIVTLLRLSPRQISDVAAFLPNQGWMDADQTLCVHKEIFGSLKTESQFSSFDFRMLVSLQPVLCPLGSYVAVFELWSAERSSSLSLRHRFTRALPI